MDQLRALEREEVHEPAPPERREVSIAHVLYWTGALAVLFALGYFLVDRWKTLKAGGVLAVALLYALSFVLSSAFLTRTGQRLAGSLFALLAVGMAPIAAWSLTSLAGLWLPPVSAVPFGPDLMGTIRWIPIELSAALAGLIALRRVRFSVLAVSVSLPFVLAMIHSTPILFDPWLDPYLWGWMALVASAALLAAGSEIDRRTRDHTDFAGFVYVTALVYGVIAIVSVGGQTRVVPHSLPLVVGLLFGLSLLTRRSLFLLFAAIVFVGYLGFLAQDVFATATGFMIVMVATGAAVILVTVAVQRRWPALARSFSRDADPRREFPRSRLLYGGILALTLVLLAVAPARAREKRRDEMNMLRERGRMAAANRREARERRREPTPTTPPQGETPVPRRP